MEFGLYKDYTSRTHGDVKIMGMIKYTSQQDLPSDLQSLLEGAKRGFEQAYAPYSRYRVGSAIKDSTGRIYIGGNQENASYPLCMCAERVALYAYSTELSKGPIKMLAVYTHSLESQADQPARLAMHAVSSSRTEMPNSRFA